MHTCIQIDPPDTITCAKEGIIDPDNVQDTGLRIIGTDIGLTGTAGSIISVVSI